jgi:hypothetical protein
VANRIEEGREEEIGRLRVAIVSIIGAGVSRKFYFKNQEEEEEGLFKTKQ